MVDELIGQQQVVVKSLLDNFDAVKGISGATILGDGRVALILDLDSLCSLPQRRWRRASFKSRTGGGRSRADESPEPGDLGNRPIPTRGGAGWSGNSMRQSN